MRKLILLALARFVWKRIQSRKAARTPRRF